MVFDKIIPTLLLLVMLTCGGGCCWIRGDCGEDPTETFATFFTLQESAVDSIDQHMGGERWHFEPSFRYPDAEIGAHFTGNSPEPVDDNCKFDDSAIKRPKDAPLLPRYEGTSTRSLKIEGDEALLAAVKFLESAGIGLEGKTTTKLIYTDASLEYVNRTPFLQKLATGDCFKQIDEYFDEPQRVVRGRLLSKMTIASNREIDNSADLKIAKVGQFTVKYDNNGGFEIIDDEIRVRAVIICRVEAIEGNANRILLEQLEQLDPDDPARGPLIGSITLSGGDEVSKDLEKAGNNAAEETVKYLKLDVVDPAWTTEFAQ